MEHLPQSLLVENGVYLSGRPFLRLSSAISYVFLNDVVGADEVFLSQSLLQDVPEFLQVPSRRDVLETLLLFWRQLHPLLKGTVGCLQLWVVRILVLGESYVLEFSAGQDLINILNGIFNYFVDWIVLDLLFYALLLII